MTDFRFPFDVELLKALNGLGWMWLDALFVGASTRTFGVGMAVLFGLWLLVAFKRKAVRPVAQAALAAVIADQFGNLVLKPQFHRLRPHLALPDVVRHFEEAAATGASMPSLHAATSFAFVVGLGLAMPATLRITLPVALLISISRVGVGVHWPSDVLVGAVYGSLIGLLMHRAAQRVWPPTPRNLPV